MRGAAVKERGLRSSRGAQDCLRDLHGCDPQRPVYVERRRSILSRRMSAQGSKPVQLIGFLTQEHVASMCRHGRYTASPTPVSHSVGVSAGGSRPTPSQRLANARLALHACPPRSQRRHPSAPAPRPSRRVGSGRAANRAQARHRLAHARRSTCPRSSVRQLHPRPCGPSASLAPSHPRPGRRAPPAPPPFRQPDAPSRPRWLRPAGRGYARSAWAMRFRQPPRQASRPARGANARVSRWCE